MEMNRRSMLAGLAVTGILPRAAWAKADGYPARDPEIIVGFSAGGAGDLAARVVAKYAQSSRGVPATLDFRPGAGGTIASDQIARGAKDGSILTLFSVSPFMVAPHIQDVAYDPETAFTYIAAFAGISIPLFVHSDSPYENWDQLLDYARANPGKLRWATAAPRGLAHIATEAALRQEGVAATFVPFGGGAEAVTALLGGHIDAVVASGYGPYLEAGSVRLLIETGPDSIAEQPDLPTFKSRGYPLAIPAAYGLVGPTGLSPEIVAWWEDLILEMTKAPEYGDFLTSLHGHALYQSSASFTQNVLQGYRSIGEQIDQLGLRP